MNAMPDARITFNVFNPEDGRVTQSNQLSDPTGYADILNERDYSFVQTAGGPLNLDAVWVKGGRLRTRPRMRITLDRTRIRAGGSDAAVFRRIPKTAKVTVVTGGLVIYHGVLGIEDLELPIPVPCVYQVTFELWPYQDWTTEVTAYAS